MKRQSAGFTYASRVLIASCILLGVFSYGFIDPNMVLTNAPAILRMLKPLHDIVYLTRPVSGAVFVSLLIAQFISYAVILRSSLSGQATVRDVGRVLVTVGAILVLSYPALSYDLFNYMTTAKMAFHWHENPYLVMPVEIPNEPYLSFTRAANKVALYGPVWILLTGVPHVLGMGNIWLTIVAFKLLAAVFYAVMCLIIWRTTRKTESVVYFALNPLVLNETLLSGHNDIVMMVFAVSGLLLARKGSWVRGWIAYLCSVLVKGATLVLAPLMFFRSWPQDRIFRTGYWLMFAVFMVAAPLREELYPWYAVWIFGMAAFLPWTGKDRILRYFTVALSVGLELRHVPYMVMGYYEGPGPLLRILLTVIPPAGYLLWVFLSGTFRRRAGK